MLFELTVFASFAVYHLAIGLCLFLLLFAFFKVIRCSAELQSWLWITAFIIATLVPFSLFVSGTPPQAKTRAINNSPLIAEQVTHLSANEIRVISREQPRTAPLQWNISSEDVLKASSGIYFFLGVWLFGSLWRASSVLRSAYHTKALINRAKKDRQTLNFKQFSHVPVLESKQAPTPMATGLLSPLILIPSELSARFSVDELEPIVLHEMAHIERRDLWASLFQEVLAIIFWWSPVMRWLNRQIHISRELACDLRAARKLSSSKRYAQSLVDCAQLMLSQHRSILAMGLFSKKSELKHRVTEVLNIKSNKTSKAITSAAACLILAGISVAGSQAYAPKINVKSISQEVHHYSSMSRELGDSLVHAIARDDRDFINQFFNQGLDINTPFQGEGTALIIAVKYKNADLVADLISMGADVNQSSENDGNPIMEAIRQNQEDMVHYLHNNGADLNAKAFGDGSPLIEAAKSGNLSIAEYLVNNGADVDMDVDGDETPLINASQNNDLAMVKFLVERGADVNLGITVTTPNGVKLRTPLNMTNNAEVRDYLSTQGAAH